MVARLFRICFATMMSDRFHWREAVVSRRAITGNVLCFSLFARCRLFVGFVASVPQGGGAVSLVCQPVRCFATRY